MPTKYLRCYRCGVKFDPPPKIQSQCSECYKYPIKVCKEPTRVSTNKTVVSKCIKDARYIAWCDTLSPRERLSRIATIV